jgi:hypothetical protein
MKQQYLIFAIEKAKGANNTEAYLKAFPKATVDSAGAAGSRLAKRDDIKNEIVRLNQTLVSAEQQAVNEVIEEKKLMFLSFADKRNILSAIANGKRRRKTWDAKTEKYIYTYPSDDDIIKAIKLDAELTGEGFRPPEDQNPGNGGGNTYNTYIRKTVFKTNVTTNKQETTQTPAE